MNDKPKAKPLDLKIPSQGNAGRDNVRKAISQYLEKTVSVWESFPITLPPTILDKLKEGHNSALFNEQSARIANDWDRELRQLATDASGKLKGLNPTQLKSVRQDGSFEVESKSLEGECHRWQISPVLQKGTRVILKDLWKGLAFVLELWICFIPALIGFMYPSPISVKDGFRSLGRMAKEFLDICIGMRWVHKQIPNVHSDRMKFILRNLTATEDELQFCVDGTDRQVIDFIFHGKATRVGKPAKGNKVHAGGYGSSYGTGGYGSSYGTGGYGGGSVSLREVSRAVVDEEAVSVVEVVSKIVAASEGEWKKKEVQFQREVILECKQSQVSDSEVPSIVAARCMNERHTMMLNAIERSDLLSEREKKHALSFAKANLIIRNCRGEWRKKLAEEERKERQRLRGKNQIRSEISSWMERRVRLWREGYENEHKWEMYDNIVQQCETDEALSEETYMIKRHIKYLRESNEYERQQKENHPNSTFGVRCRIWRPSHWMVTCTISDGPGREKRVEGPYHEMIKNYPHGRHWMINSKSYQLASVTTKHPLWRLRFLFWWMLMVINNVAYGSLIGGVMYGPLSFYALLCVSPFVPGRRLNVHTAEFEADPLTKTETFISRLRNMWKAIATSRREFEATPDEGFLGKAWSRFFHRIWNYIVRGLLGTIVLVTVFPTACVLLGAISLVVFVMSPAVGPVATVFKWVFNLLIYDDTCVKETWRRPGLTLFGVLVWRLVIRGAIQIVGCMVLCVCCQLLSALLLLRYITRYILRNVWDAVVFFAVIRTRARIPVRNTFVAKRVHGPGVGWSYFYSVSDAQAMMAVKLSVEQDEIKAFEQVTKDTMLAPTRLYQQELTEIVKVFGATCSTIPPWMREETQKLTKFAEQRITRINKFRRVIEERNIKHRIRFTEEQLTRVTSLIAQMLEKTFPSVIAEANEKFWTSKHLMDEDWHGLATYYLTRSFSPDIVTPLEVHDRFISLEISTDRSIFETILVDGKLTDPLDDTRLVSHKLMTDAAMARENRARTELQREDFTVQRDGEHICHPLYVFELNQNLKDIRDAQKKK